MLASLAKTGRLVIVSEACERGSFAMTLAANVARFGFGALKAPPRVLGSPNWIVPGADMESTYFPQVDDILDVVLGEFFPEKRANRRGVRGWDDIALARRRVCEQSSGDANGRERCHAESRQRNQRGADRRLAPKAVGDDVDEGEHARSTITTPKVTLEIEAPAAGVLKSILVPADEIAAVGDTLAVIAAD